MLKINQYRIVAPVIFILTFVVGCNSNSSGGGSSATNSAPVANAGPDQNVTTGSLV